MANASTGRTRLIACILVGLGAFALIAAILVPTYTKSVLKKNPLNLEVTIVSTGQGSVLDANSVLGNDPVKVDQNVPLQTQRYITVQDPSNANEMTLQVGQTLRRTDKQADTGILSATVDTVTIDRKTSLPIDSDTNGTIEDTKGTAPAPPVRHQGLQYKFPFDVKQQSYPYFDTIARKTYDINFLAEEEINGMKVYHFQQSIDPVDLTTISKAAPNQLTLSAKKWGVDKKDDASVTMKRYYADTRDVWVDPITGVIVKGSEHVQQYYARDAKKPEVTAADFTSTFNEPTIEYQLGQAKDGQDKLSLYAKVLPIILAIVGIVLLAIGIFLGVRSGKGNPGGGNRHESDGYDPTPPQGAAPHAGPDLNKPSLHKHGANPDDPTETFPTVQ